MKLHLCTASEMTLSRLRLLKNVWNTESAELHQLLCVAPDLLQLLRRTQVGQESNTIN